MHQCPVCSKFFAPTKLNKHLDACLQGGASAAAATEEPEVAIIEKEPIPPERTLLCPKYEDRIACAF